MLQRRGNHYRNWHVFRKCVENKQKIREQVRTFHGLKIINYKLCSVVEHFLYCQARSYGVFPRHNVSNLYNYIIVQCQLVELTDTGSELDVNGNILDRFCFFLKFSSNKILRGENRRKPRINIYVTTIFGKIDFAFLL